MNGLFRFLAGENLEDVAEYSEQDSTELYARPLSEACFNLMGYPPDSGLRMTPDSLQGTEIIFAALWDLFFKIIKAIYLDHYESAEGFMSELKRRKRSVIVPRLIENQVVFCQGLIAAVLASRSRGRLHRKRLCLAQRTLRKLRTQRADEDPTLWNKVFLLEAQIHACFSQHESALLLFLKSVEVADHEGFLHEQALAYELAGKMCQGCSREGEAQFYLSQAQAFYGRWGALAKMDQLDQPKSARSNSTRTQSTSSARSQNSFFPL